MKLIKIVFLIFVLMATAMADEVQDSRWIVGSFAPAIDKQAHFLGGFGAYSVIERITDKRVAQYGFVLLISGVKETADSYRTQGDFADISYAMAGAMACDYLLTKLKLKTGDFQISVNKNKILLAINL